jgi:hypothetical protein
MMHRANNEATAYGAPDLRQSAWKKDTGHSQRDVDKRQNKRINMNQGSNNLTAGGTVRTT